MLNIYIAIFIHISMGNLKIIRAALAVVLMHGFIQQIICMKPIFIKNEYLNLHKPKSEVEYAISSDWYMNCGINKLFNVEKMKINFQCQTPTILNINCSFCTPSTIDLYYTEQMTLTLNTRLNFMNSSLPIHLSSQLQSKSIFEHVHDEYFSYLTHFVCSIFDFSWNDTNIYCSANIITLIVIVLFIFLTLFNNKNPRGFYLKINKNN